MSRALQSIQTDFQSYVIGTNLDAPAIAHDIAAQFGMAPIGRLKIYHDAYRIRMREALSEAYDKTHAYLGDEIFAELSAGYLRDYASHYRNLRWYGDCFADYLMRALPEHPVVAELAAFEWALGLAFDAADAPTLTPDDVRTLDVEAWDHIGFSLQPSAQFLNLQWNVTAIWLALDQDATPPDAAANAAPVHWLVWRKDLQPHFRSLNAYEAHALQGLLGEQSFSSVCEEAASSAGEKDITPQIAGWLQTWLSEGVLADIQHGVTQRYQFS